jgi:hypothetical protein
MELRTLVSAVSQLRSLVGPWNVSKLLAGENVFLTEKDPVEANLISNLLKEAGLYVHVSDSPSSPGKQTILTHLV